MNQNKLNENQEFEVDLGRVLRAVLSKSWLVAVVAVLCAVTMFVVTLLFITPQYESTAMFYVNNNSLSVGDASFSISSGDLSTSRNLVDSYVEILKTRETLNAVIEYAESERSYSELKKMISAGAVNETEIFQVTVTAPDPAEAERIASAITIVLPERIGTIIQGSSAKIVDAPVVASKASSPSYAKNVLLGFLLGFAMSVAVVALREIFDVMIRTEEDISEVCANPVLASVPDMNAVPKGGYYSYGRNPEKKNAAAQKRTLMGKDISFAAAEAYKLLRTKLQFSFSEEGSCRVIAVSSSFSGEGKSLTAVNLAYTLSQLNKKVILIDCDMRRPTLAEKLHIQKKPGLSSCLTGQCHLTELVQECSFSRSEIGFHVIAAGENPPNPVELLSSSRMDKMIEVLRTAYDYVVLDLPPVGEVSDAMVVAKQTDGVLLVVRQNVCERNALAEAIRQFQFVEAKILGVVFNGVNESGGKRYYKKNYGGSYGAAAPRNENGR